jgi:hypothetical protein
MSDKPIEAPEHLIRDLRASDHAFIIESWSNALRSDNSWFRTVDSRIYFGTYKPLVGELITDPANVVRLACLPEDTDTILSYIVFSPATRTFHWAYTKAAWRRLGLVRSLLTDLPPFEFVSHLTDMGLKLKPKEWRFNPFL